MTALGLPIRGLSFSLLPLLLLAVCRTACFVGRYLRTLSAAANGICHSVPASPAQPDSSSSPCQQPGAPEAPLAAAAQQPQQQQQQNHDATVSAAHSVGSAASSLAHAAEESLAGLAVASGALSTATMLQAKLLPSFHPDAAAAAATAAATGREAAETHSSSRKVHGSDASADGGEHVMTMGGAAPAAKMDDNPAVTYAELAASVYKATEEVIGPLSLGDLVFGLQAVAKKHRAQGLAYAVQVGKISSACAP